MVKIWKKSVYRDTPWKWNFIEHSCAWKCQSIDEQLWEIFYEIFLIFFKNRPQLVFL